MTQLYLVPVYGLAFFVALACSPLPAPDTPLSVAALSSTAPRSRSLRSRSTSLGRLEICSVGIDGVLWCNDRLETMSGDSPARRVGAGYERVVAAGNITCAITEPHHRQSRPSDPSWNPPEVLSSRHLRCWLRIQHDRDDARVRLVSLRIPAELDQIVMDNDKVCAFGDHPSACVVFDTSTPLPHIPYALDRLTLGIHHACWSRARIEEVVCSGPLALGTAPRVCDSNIASGADYSCCESDGDLVCWGLERFSLRSELRHPVVMIAAGDRHFCYVDTERDVYCGGDCRDGQCGIPDINSWIAEPTRLDVGPTSEVLIDGGETCLALESGERLCW